MSEEELNEAMQYNLDYTEAMLNDELFGTNEVAEVKLLASEKTIRDLQQKVEQLEKENKELKYLADDSNTMKAFIVEHNKAEQLENIRKEAIDYIENNWITYNDSKNLTEFNEELPVFIKEINILLNILNKGEKK
jgi:cell division protein FtsX